MQFAVVIWYGHRLLARAAALWITGVTDPVDDRPAATALCLKLPSTTSAKPCSSSQAARAASSARKSNRGPFGLNPPGFRSNSSGMSAMVTAGPSWLCSGASARSLASVAHADSPSCARTHRASSGSAASRSRHRGRLDGIAPRSTPSVSTHARGRRPGADAGPRAARPSPRRPGCATGAATRPATTQRYPPNPQQRSRQRAAEAPQTSPSLAAGPSAASAGRHADLNGVTLDCSPGSRQSPPASVHATVCESELVAQVTSLRGHPRRRNALEHGADMHDVHRHSRGILSSHMVASGDGPELFP